MANPLLQGSRPFRRVCFSAIQYRMSSALALRRLSNVQLENPFTTQLTPDQATPDPATIAQMAQEDPALSSLRRMRMVRGHFSYITPDTEDWGTPHLLLNSHTTIKDILGLDDKVIEGEEADQWLRLVSGRDNDLSRRWEKEKSGHSWAQCYGGHQFGNWAGQLGDGRAIVIAQLSPHTMLNARPAPINAYQNGTPVHSLDMQLKGAGKTPYGRFADGLAVLRSSIREFLASEYLASLGIPTTRAAALVHYPQKAVRRERLESSAIVTRVAPGSWIRFGSFEIHWSRNDRTMLKQLADYAYSNVFDSLPALAPEGKQARSNLSQWQKDGQDLKDGSSMGAAGSIQTTDNPYALMLAAIAARHAKMTAYHQAYGFLNGVNNSDNQLITGQTLDFGPFAFLDVYDPSYTPNHDDQEGRYSYSMQPGIAKENLQYLGNALGELIGAYASGVRGSKYTEVAHYKGTDAKSEEYQQWKSSAIAQIVGWGDIGERVVKDIVQGFTKLYIKEYKSLMFKRLGLESENETDFREILSPLLDLMEESELDYHHTLRLLCQFPAMLDSSDVWTLLVEAIIPEAYQPNPALLSAGRAKLRSWLSVYAERLRADGVDNLSSGLERQATMRELNPRFILRSWILNEILDAWRPVEQAGLGLGSAQHKTREESQKEELKAKEILTRIYRLVQRPFEQYGERDLAKGLDATTKAVLEDEEDARLCGLGERKSRMAQCSCSS